MKPAALVTGAGSGIGAAIALELSRKGYFVHLLGRNERRLAAVREKIPDSNVVLCDLANPEAVERAAANVLADRGSRLEVLVNNAGIFERHSVTDGTDAIWTAQFETNLLGPVRLTRALWPHFEKQGKGSIVNVSSTLGLKPAAGTGAYSAIKAAMVNWTLNLAMEGGPSKIRANCVCPGIVDTPIHPFHALSGSDKALALEKMASLQPLGRIGRPEDVAPTVALLASDESSWTTGAVVSVDGGIGLA